MGKPRPTPEINPFVARQEELQRQRSAAQLADLRALDCLQDVPEGELKHVIDLGTLRVFGPHERLFQARQYGTYLYLLLHGTMRLVSHTKDGCEVLLGVLGRGDCCGEGLLFGDYFRHVEAYPETPCVVLQVPLEPLQALLASAHRLNTALRQVYRQRLVLGTLARVPLFRHLSPAERLVLAAALQPRHARRDEVIIAQGDPADTLYVIEMGQLSVDQDSQTLAVLREGDFFGEAALLSKQPASVTIRALAPTDMLTLSVAALDEVLASHPDLRQRLVQTRLDRSASCAMLQHNVEQAHQLTQASQHGLLRGSNLLVRDPHLCPPGCRMCELACEMRHGQQRMHLRGVTMGLWDVLATCYQCLVGPECVAACPEDAFQRTAQGALVITDACTGCGACLAACPYAALERVLCAPRRALTQPWAEMTRQRLLPLLSRFYAAPELRADKCNLCHGYANRACQHECPTGALQLLPVEEIVPL